MTKNNKIKIIVIPFIITVIVVLIGLILGNFEPFGKNDVLSTYENGSYIGFFYEMYDTFHGGRFALISNVTGLPHDTTSNIAYYFSDPLNWTILLFPRQSLPTVFNILYVLKLGFASSSFAYFLLYLNPTIASTNTSNSDANKKGKTNFEIAINYKPKNQISSFIFDNILLWSLSLAYSLSSSFLIIGMNICYTSAMAILPLVVVGVLDIINNGKLLKFVIFYSISFYLNLHITLITSMFILLFFLTRDFNNKRHFIESLFSLVRGVIISFLFASPVIINSLHSPLILTNYRTNFPLFHINNPLDYSKQLFPGSGPSVLSLYLNNADLYFCFISILCLFLLLFNKSFRMSERIKDFVLFFVVFISASTTTFKHLLNCLLVSDGILYSYIIAFVGLYITYKALINISFQSLLSVNISALLTGVLVISCMLFSTMYDSSSIFIYSVELLFFYYFVLLIRASNSINNYIFYILVSIVILLEVCLSLPNQYKRLGNTVFAKGLTQTYSYEYYEVARSIQKLYPDSSVLIYNGEANNYDISVLSFLGYDYIINYNSSEIAPSLEKIDIDNDFPNISVYKNNYTLKTAYFPIDIEHFHYENSSPFLSFNNISRMVSDCEVYVQADPEVSVETTYDNKYVNFIISTEYNGDMYFKGYFINYLGYTEANETKNVMQSVPATSNDSYYYQLYSFNIDNYNEVFNRLCTNTQNTSILVNKKYNLSFSDNGYLSIPYYYDTSLSFYVNGNKVKPKQFYDYISIIPVNKGNNTVQIKYNPIYLIISFINIIIALIVTIVVKRGDNNDR